MQILIMVPASTQLIPCDNGQQGYLLIISLTIELCLIGQCPILHHHIMIRYRELGTQSWTVITAGPVNSNEFNGTNRTRYFMSPSTTYEWSMRARVLNEEGSITCQSPWSVISQYTTLDACPNLENLSVSKVESNWVTFNADTPDLEWGVWQSKEDYEKQGQTLFAMLMEQLMEVLAY